MKNVCWSLSLAVGLALVTIFPSQAAERIVLKYSVLSESVPVSELSELSRSGEVSPALESYLNLANKKPEELRQWLTQSFKIDSVVLSNVLNSFAGKYILGQVGDVIHTPSQRSNTEALRGALVSSAVNDNSVQLIEVLENYPTAELHVNGDRLMELYQKLKGITGGISQLPF